MTSENNRLEDIVQSKWPVQWSETPRVNRWYNNVRRISETHVAKIPRQFLQRKFPFYLLFNEEDKMESLKRLKHEFDLQKQAYDLGLSVPKPEGIFEVKLSDSELILPGFVMEYVEGPILDTLLNEGKRDVFTIASNLMFKELDNAREIGFSPVDYHYLNAIWNFERERVYLIDLAQWRFAGK